MVIETKTLKMRLWAVYWFAWYDKLDEITKYDQEPQIGGQLSSKIGQSHRLQKFNGLKFSELRKKWANREFQDTQKTFLSMRDAELQRDPYSTINTMRDGAWASTTLSAIGY
jgi:hypothetical protein